MAKPAVNMQVVQVLKSFLGFEAAAYAVAAAMHLTAVHPMRQDAWAGGAETFIALALAAGYIGLAKRPGRAIRLALTAQLFALVVTLVGLFVVMTTLTAETMPALVFHLAATLVVVAGIVFALTNRSSGRA